MAKFEYSHFEPGARVSLVAGQGIEQIALGHIGVGIVHVGRAVVSGTAGRPDVWVTM